MWAIHITALAAPPAASPTVAPITAAAAAPAATAPTRVLAVEAGGELTCVRVYLSTCLHAMLQAAEASGWLAASGGAVPSRARYPSAACARAADGGAQAAAAAAGELRRYRLRWQRHRPLSERAIVLRTVRNL